MAPFRFITAKQAAALDRELMSPSGGGFSLDQLMELAGLSVSQAVFKVHPPAKGRNVLVACGPGNNGGDGLVCARHLHHYGYKPTVYYPKPGRHEFYARLQTQLRNLHIPVITSHDDSVLASALKETDHIVDALFGFSFSGQIREPFGAIITAIVKSGKGVTSVDAPSGWGIDTGKPSEGPAKDFMPSVLVSLTAVKPVAKEFTGRQFLGGRFVAEETAKRWALRLPEYPGLDQVVEIDGKDWDLGSEEEQVAGLTEEEKNA